MKFVKSLTIALLVTLSLSVNSFAGDTHSGRAFVEAGKASSHASASAGHSVAGAAQVASTVLAVPLFVSGALGGLSNDIAIDLMDFATAPIGTPLEITDESMTVGPAPNHALKENI
jgi:hypothetical protein